MKNTLKLLTCVAAVSLTMAARGESVRENTFIWQGGVDHSGWKALSNYPIGYVIGGNKFFEPSNTSIFVTGFNELVQHEWTTTHTTTQHGFTQLNPFWKSIVPIGPASNPAGFFFASSGTRAGTNSYYTLRVQKTGQFLSDSFGPLGGGFQFGGAGQAHDGGYIAVGGTNNGMIGVAKFGLGGELQTTVSLPIQGFGWTVQPAPGGGYVIGSTGAIATRIDDNFNIDWSTTVSLPASPPHDGSAYTYTEFEEIVPLKNTGDGFVMTGSAFSNSTSAVYTARLSWDGVVLWNKINDFANTTLVGTPVAWTNSAVESQNPQSGVWEIFFSWRKGPVSAGGVLFGERMNPANGNTVQLGSLHNNIPVQEAFTVRQYFLDRIVIAGVRGGYSAAYAFATDNLPNSLSLNGMALPAQTSTPTAADTPRVTNAPR